MFDRKTYRDQVLRPLLKDKTRLSALGDARRTLRQADSDESLLQALTQVDAAALLAVPDDASELDLARHFSQLEGFLSTGSHPVSKQLDQLLAVLKSKVGDDYRKPAFWAQVSRPAQQPQEPEPEVSDLVDLKSREVLAKSAGAMQANLSKAVYLVAAPLSQAARTLGALEQAATEDPSLIGGAAPAADQKQEPEPEPVSPEPEPVSPDLTTVKELVETGRLQQARQVFEKLTEDAEESPLLEEVSTALHAAELLKRLALDEYRQALDEHDYPTAAQSLARAREIDQADEQLRRLEQQLPPGPPTGLQAGYSTADNAVHLTWQGPPGDSVRYRVARAGAGPGSTETVLETADQQATDTDPVTAQEMVYAVWAVRGQACSEPATVTVTALPAPTRVTASVTGSDLLLRWYCPEQATAVSVDLYGPDEQHFPRLARDELLVSGLVLGQTYEIFLTAHYLVQGEPACSEAATVTAVPREAAYPVTDLKVAAGPGHPARAEWSTVRGYQTELWALPLERGLPVGSRVPAERLEALGGQRLTGPQQEQGLLRSQVLDQVAGLRACYPVTWDGDEGLVGAAVTVGEAPSASEVEAVRFGSELVVSWVWPEGDHRMSVSWSGLDDQRGERRVSRVDYQRDGGVRIPRADLVTEVVVRTVVATPAGDLVCSPVVVSLAAVPPRLAYTLRLPRRLLGGREATLQLTSAGFRGVAELVVVMSTGDYMPSSPDAGQQIARLGVDLTTSPTQTVTFTVPKVKSYWLRVFAAHPGRLTLQDPPTPTLKG
ncbi:MAG: hypothetical protein Q4G45_07495 [Actinomycetia bacterium]|nr:hypothetical protein [Actinomycetes bacterium]